MIESTESQALAGLVDLEVYPIAALERADGKALVKRLRRQLRADGLCVLPGFLTPTATRALAQETEELAPVAYRGPTTTTVYYGKDAEGFPDGHPRRLRVPREMNEVAYDQIPVESGLKRLYHSTLLPRFLAAVLGVGKLHRYADPYQAITLSITGQGEGQNWHFDDTDFITTLLLQAPEQGGEFECVPNLRSATDENYAGVLRVLEGARDAVKTVPFTEGSMMIFQGLYSLHQVAPVIGRRKRIVAVLSYDTRPGQVAPPGRNLELFGPRVMEADP